MALLRPLFATLALLAAILPTGARAEDDLVKAELVSDVSTVVPGQPFWLGVRLHMKEGWHVYWKFPGDSGLPTRIEWKAPQGVEVGEIQWPTPERWIAGGLASQGYGHEVVLLNRATPGQVKGDLPIQADVSWLACNEDRCIPGKASVKAKLATGTEAAKSDDAAAIEKSLAKVPGKAPWPVSFAATEKSIALQVKGEPGVAGATFFPEQEGVLELAKDQVFESRKDGFVLRLTPSSYASEAPKELRGVLKLADERAFDVVATPGKIEAATVAATAVPPPVAPAAPEKAELGLVEVLFFALLGGVILNLMPCVFPVLSLKVLGVAQQASEEPKRVRMHGLAYTAGILVSFAILAGALIALREGGARIGWGFQLQSPGFVAILAFVLFAMALSLSGVVEFGNSIMGVGSGLASKPGLSGSFFTGVLATVVATPCTAPFMGAAVGYALTQPAAFAMSVFLALGLGLALPFLVLSYVPALHKLMPRPGAWMLTLKQVLAFPLYGTVAWLVWVLSLQAGAEGLAAVLAGLVLVAFAAWAWGASRHAKPTFRRLGTGSASVACIAALALVRLPGAASATPAQPAAVKADGGQHAEVPFTQAGLDALLAEGKPVFIDFTAAWCVTCLVNEKNALDKPAVREAFARKGVTFMKGDWTNEDPAITAVLEKFGRSGVPLYLLYPGKGKEPIVLEQILTESMVVGHLEQI